MLWWETDEWRDWALEEVVVGGVEGFACVDVLIVM